MSWDNYGSGGGWDTQGVAHTSLQSPQYDLGERKFGPVPGVDPYYASAQSISVPAQPGHLGLTASAPAVVDRQSTSLMFQSSGVVQGMDPTRWVNKETATVCKLCDAPFSSLTKRRHNCRVCGDVYCGNCSADKLNIAHKGLDRVCFICYSANASLTSEEQTVITQVCEDLGEYPQMQTMVFRKKDSGTSNRHHTMVIVSRYKILCLRRNSPGSAYKSFNLLDLTRIIMTKHTTLVLEFGKQTGVLVTEQYDTFKAPELLLTIRTQHARIANGMPAHCQLIVEAPPDGLLPMAELPPVGVAGGFIDAYRAWCNFYGTEASQELIQYVTDSVERTPFVLDLSLCPGIEPGTNVSFDLQPVFQALRHNSYYLALDLCGVTAKGAMTLLAPCLKVNRNLTRLRLSNLATSHLTLIGHALAENGPNHLQDLDLSGTSLSEKAVRALSLSFVTKEFGLRRLKLSNCMLSPKSVGTIFREGFLPSPEVTMLMEELDLSDNKFDEESSLLLQVWLSKMGKRSSMRRLNIARCNATLGLIIPALELIPNLESANFAENLLDSECALVLANILKATPQLKILDVSNCNLTPSTTNIILTAVVRNPALSDCRLYFAGVPSIDDTNIIQITSALSMSQVLHTLDLSQMRLGEKGIIDLFLTLTSNALALNSLILSDFFHNINGLIPGTRVGHMLADMVIQLPRLRELDVSVSKLPMFTNSGPAHVLLPFLQRMQRNENLQKLNIKGNRLGDKIATTLADVLRCNTTLICVNADDNRVSLTGFQALEYALQRNRTLQKFENPVQDITRLIKSGTLSDEKQVHLFTVMYNIQLAVNFNQHANGVHQFARDSTYEEPPAAPLVVYSESEMARFTPSVPVAPPTQPWSPPVQEYPQAHSAPFVAAPVAHSYDSSTYQSSPSVSEWDSVSSSSNWSTPAPSPIVNQDDWGSFAAPATPAVHDDRTNDLFSALASVLDAPNNY